MKVMQMQLETTEVLFISFVSGLLATRSCISPYILYRIDTWFYTAIHKFWGPILAQLTKLLNDTSIKGMVRSLQYTHTSDSDFQKSPINVEFRTN